MSPAKPPRQYLSAEHVLGEMCAFGSRRLDRLDTSQILILGMIGGGFIAMGALFSVLLAQGSQTAGLVRLLEGLGFSAGFFFVVLSEAVLFTEANVVLPAVLLYGRRSTAVGRVSRFWILAWLGNLLGALLTAWMVMSAQRYGPDFFRLLEEIVERKMEYARLGTATAWGRAVLSGVIANWLVGMAAFFATMARTVVGKYIPVFLAVTLFVAANFQHSPANMGYFALASAAGGGAGWDLALAWNIVPVGIGNILGGGFLVALPFWFALRPEERDQAVKGR